MNCNDEVARCILQESIAIVITLTDPDLFPCFTRRGFNQEHSGTARGEMRVNHLVYSKLLLFRAGE